MPSLSTIKLIGWAIAAFAFIACLAALRMEQAQNGKLKAQLHESTTLRAADRAAYEQAQRDAAARNKAQVAAVEAQQKRISDDAKTAYERDLAELRRLRPKAAPRPAGTAGPSPSPAPSGGADGDGLRLSTDEYLQAQEIELRLMHLQNWVEKQLNVNPN